MQAGSGVGSAQVPLWHSRSPRQSLDPMHASPATAFALQCIVASQFAKSTHSLPIGQSPPIGSLATVGAHVPAQHIMLPVHIDLSQLRDTHSSPVKQAAPSATVPLTASVHDCGVVDPSWSVTLQLRPLRKSRQSAAA